MKKKSRKELEKELIDWSEQLKKIEDEGKYWSRRYQEAKTEKEAEELDKELCILRITRNLVKEQVEGIKKLLETWHRHTCG